MDGHPVTTNELRRWDSLMICAVTVGDIDADGSAQFRDFEIASFSELVDFFDEVYADFSQQLDEDPYGPPPVDKKSGVIIGGFGVRCKNMSGCEIEVGIGREWWLLIDLEPEGSAFVVDDQPPDHDFIVFLDGWTALALVRTT